MAERIFSAVCRYLRNTLLCEIYNRCNERILGYRETYTVSYFSPQLKGGISNDC